MRRFGLTCVVLVITLFVTIESAWACKFLDNLLGRRSSRNCCCQQADPTCCGPIEDATKKPATKLAPAPKAPVVKKSAVKPAPAPKAPVVKKPAVKPAPTPKAPVAKKPAVKPAPTPKAPVVKKPAVKPAPVPVPVPKAPKAKKPAVKLPVPKPVEKPVTTPAPKVEKPAVKPIEKPVATPAVKEPVKKPKKELIDDPFAGRSNGYRIWTDTTGKHNIEARFVSSFDGTIRLQKRSGGYVRINLDRLCTMDQMFLRNRLNTLVSN